LPAGAVAPGQTDAETEQKERPEPPQPRPALRQLAKLANLVDQEKSSAQQVLALDTVPGCTGDVPTSTSSHIDRMAQSAKTGRSYAQAAVNAQVGGYIRKAIDLYDTAILAGDLSRNNLAKVYNNRGAAYRILGFSGLAIDDYNEAMRLKPNYAAAYFNRGVAYRLNNKQKLAIKDFTRSIQLDSGFADPFVQRGMTYAQEGAHKRAISDFSRAIQLAPCLASAYFNRGRMFESLGHLERAIDDFRKSYSLSPNSKKFKEKLLSLTAP
jgi:tetratricopeptide (TPR) repeat protein